MYLQSEMKLRLFSVFLVSVQTVAEADVEVNCQHIELESFMPLCLSPLYPIRFCRILPHSGLYAPLPAYLSSLSLLHAFLHLRRSGMSVSLISFRILSKDVKRRAHAYHRYACTKYLG